MSIGFFRKDLILFLLTIIIFSFFDIAFAQPDLSANNFRSSDNILYWKNRPPFPGYWQQDVYYIINASVDERTDIISGSEKLTYWNNSPDTLSYVFFHLYQQAFVKGGHLENLNRNNNYKQSFGKYEKAGLGEIVSSIRTGNTELKTELDYSVMKAYLERPLLPGDSVVFEITFKTYFDTGSQRRRMKKFSVHGLTHYDGVHWYPRICVYDRKSGWDTNQHLGKEFYGDFGTYDVHLTFAANYVVGATGTLLNEDDVLPDDLRQKLDIRNFAKKPWESSPSIITPYDSSQHKTWHFYADNVHDFAWTADPTYRIGETYASIWDANQHQQKRVLCQALVQEPHAAGWLDAAIYTARLIEVYSRDFGMYNWPKIAVADARDGMEYPMLTLDGGYAPAYYDLLAHEVGHMWFFGQVGNNETYQAPLDEGFTQFIESWALRKIVGDTMLEPAYKNKYYAHFKRPNLVMDEEVYFGYLQDAAKGTDESINQHSDAFNGALGHGGGYRHVYYKTATMLWNLQYVLGDSLFQQAMRHYYDQWKFCHPYIEDFRNSVIQYTHVDLNWFFDEWMETTKTIDYRVRKVQCINTNDAAGNSSYEIEFRRRGRSQMPIDFSVIGKDNKRYDFYIPNTWFEKQSNAVVLPKWYGWDKLHPTYSCKVSIPANLKDVIIDPTHRLADVYMPDNYKKPKLAWHFDSQVSNLPDWRKYEINWRPDVWYNAVDGIKIGFHLDGDYFDLKNKFWITAWYNSKLLRNGIPEYHLEETLLQHTSPVSFNSSYSTNTHRFIKNSSVNLALKYLDGLWSGSAGFAVRVNAKNSFSLAVKSMYRKDAADLMYLLYPELWQAGKWNNTATLGYEHPYTYFTGNGDINLSLRSASLFSDYNYADLTMTAVNRNKIGKLNFNTRLIARIGTGDVAPESGIYLAGASPEEMMEDKFVRSKGFIPQDWLGYGATVNHFQQGGGLNVRGYAGYLAPELNVNDGKIYYLYQGNSGFGFNAELEFDQLVKLSPGFLKSWLHADTYFFGDAGTIGYRNAASNFFLSTIRADAGIGFAFTIKDWGPLEKVKPLTLRVDFPLFINRLPATDSDYFDFRWVVGVGRAF